MPRLRDRRGGRAQGCIPEAAAAYAAAGAPERALDLFADLRMFSEARAFAAALPPEAPCSAPSGEAAAGASADGARPGTPGALHAPLLPEADRSAGGHGPLHGERGGATALAAQPSAKPAAQAGAGAPRPAAQGLAGALGAAPRDALLDRLCLREAQWLEAGGGDLPAAAAAYAQARRRAARVAARAQGAVAAAARGMHCSSAQGRRSRSPAWEEIRHAGAQMRRSHQG